MELVCYSQSLITLNILVAQELVALPSHIKKCRGIIISSVDTNHKQKMKRKMTDLGISRI
jgi:hypothetical protein